MHQKNKNRHKLKIIIATILIIAIATGCTTTKHREKAIINTLELQNEAIDSVTSSDVSKKGSITGEVKNVNSFPESAAFKALVAIKESNEMLIKKLKPETKKECHCGQNERTCDRSSKQH